MVVVYRKTPAVPVLPWNWLKSTSEFETSLLSEIDETAKDYKIKEEYAKRFMILFCPLRLETSLSKNGSYQAGLRSALAEMLITEEMQTIANNIQNIHNSLGSAMPENVLTSTTELIEADEIQNDGDEDVGAALEAMLLNIGSVLASYDSFPQLKEEAT